MDAVSSLNISILLVDGNAANAARLSLLLESKYKVMTTHTGNDARRILGNSQHGVDLVMVSIGLPDMCSLEFIRIVDKEIQLAAVMICDFYDQRLMMEGSMCGAAGAFVKPLCFDDIKDLWQFPAIKQSEMNMLHEAKTKDGVPQSNGFPVSYFRRFEHTMHGSSSGSQMFKKKSDEAGRVNGCSVGQSSAFIRSQDVKYKIPVAIQQYSLAKAMFAVGAHRIFAPGVTCICDLVERRLQLFRAHMKQKFESLPLTAIAPNWPAMAAQPMHPDDDDDDDDDEDEDEDEDEQEEESFLARYLENPYSREQLKMVVKVATLKWYGKPRALMEETPLPPPPASSEGPTVLLPVSLARQIEKIVHVNMASLRVPDASEEARNNLATRVGSIGPPGSSVLPEGGEELDPDLIDISDIFDAIAELEDGTF